MRTGLLVMSGAISCLALGACTQTVQFSQVAPVIDQNPVQAPAIQAPPVEEIKRQDLKIRQVQTPAEAEAENALTLQQLAPDVDDLSENYAFEAVEGDFPCQGAAQRVEDCGVASRAITAENETSSSGRGGQSASAEAELQTLTNRVIDPDTFDPVTTLDEIGRGDQFSSLAAQSVGSDFLVSGNEAAVPLEESPAAQAQDGSNALPPFILDVTVTQGAPGQ